MRVDLHLHSNASDGAHAPGEVMRIASAAGMSLVALTDHDTLDGVAEAQAAADAAGLAFVPGVELSCEGDAQIHLLGYGVDMCSPLMCGFSAQRRQARRERAEQIILLLRNAGCRADFDVLLAADSVSAISSISRVHIAQALVRAGEASSIKEAFSRYLSPGRSAYVGLPDVSVAEALHMLQAACAVAVLAHPGLVRVREEVLQEKIRIWRDNGLAGLEAFHTRHTQAQAYRYVRIARTLGMQVTGGSDFHGETIRQVRIGEGMSGWHSMASDGYRLWSSLQHRYGVLPITESDLLKIEGETEG